MNTQWFEISTEQLIHIPVSAIFIYAMLVLMVRVNGLRSFSKMSSFDFAVTVAIGSIIASTVVAKSPPVLAGALAIATLLLIQRLVARLRIVSDHIEGHVDNSPLLLMEGDEILWDNLEKSRVSYEDLLGKLREANCLNFQQVRFVVLESTGEISVLHSMDADEIVDEELLKGVKRAV